MTSRSDLPRVFAALQVLGTEAETPTEDGRSKIALAWDTTHGWQQGPQQAPQRGERGGGGGEAGAEDAKDELRQRRRAAEKHRELVDTIARLDQDTQTLFRLIDMAVPPNPSDVKNRRTEDFEPWTEAEIVLAGWCANCWLACQAWSPIPVDRKGFKKWKDRCGWCGPFRAAHGIDAPKDLVVKHNEGHSLSAGEVEAAVAKAKQAAQPKGKKRKGKKAKAA